LKRGDKIVGYRNSGTVQNNAALGASVTANGTSATRVAARVYAYPASGGDSPNYAKDLMRLEKSSAYGTLYFPFWDGSGMAPSAYYVNSSSASNADPNGQSVSASAFFSQNIWTSSSSYLNFSAAYWNFTSVMVKGYPTLIGVGGQ
jgi:hypothetical protein